jgi:hypothetical protein
MPRPGARRQLAAAAEPGEVLRRAVRVAPRKVAGFTA